MLHIVPEAVESPACCAVSLSTTGPYLDTQVTIPRWGRLYLSVPWLTSIAGDLGWVPKDDYDVAMADLDVAMVAVGDLSARVERFDEDVQNVSDALISFLAVVHSRADVVDELKGAREAVATLAARVAELEAGE